MPEIRPFRALRYDSASVSDPALVVAPPYDVIGPAEQAAQSGTVKIEPRWHPARRWMADQTGVLAFNADWE